MNIFSLADVIIERSLKFSASPTFHCNCSSEFFSAVSVPLPTQNFPLLTQVNNVLC